MRQCDLQICLCLNTFQEYAKTVQYIRLNAAEEKLVGAYHLHIIEPDTKSTAWHISSPNSTQKHHVLAECEPSTLASQESLILTIQHTVICCHTIKFDWRMKTQCFDKATSMKSPGARLLHAH